MSDEQLELLRSLFYKYQLFLVITIEYHSDGVHSEIREIKSLLTRIMNHLYYKLVRSSYAKNNSGII